MMLDRIPIEKIIRYESRVYDLVLSWKIEQDGVPEPPLGSGGWHMTTEIYEKDQIKGY